MSLTCLILWWLEGPLGCLDPPGGRPLLGGRPLTPTKPPGGPDVWSTSPQKGSGCSALHPQPHLPPPNTDPQGDRRQPHPLPPPRVSSCTPAAVTGPPCPEGHPYSPFQTEASGHFLLPPAPSAHRAFLQAPRFHAEASSSLEGTREGLKAPERVLGPGLDGALQRPAQRLRS